MSKQDLRTHMDKINNLVHAIEALQEAGVSVEIEQLENGKFDVGLGMGDSEVIVTASYPKEEGS